MMTGRRPAPTQLPGQAQGGTTAPTPPAPPAGAAPADVYQGFRAQQRELVRQRESLEEAREEIQDQLREGPASDADRAGLEQRLAAIDQQLAAKQIAIAEADALVAQAAAVPGATVTPPRPPDRLTASDVAEMSAVVFTLLAFPIVLAWARRIWRRSSVTINLPPDLTDRLGGMERAIDTVAVEVERIGEGQRFVTQLLASRPAASGQLARGPDEGHV